MEEKIKEKRCHNCKFFATKDEGYSNYTVLETIIHCMKELNPAFPMEESYSWEDKLEHANHAIMKVAESCKSYKFGENQVGLDVDGETSLDQWKEDDELYQIAKKYWQ